MLGAITTPINFGAAPLNIKIRRVTPAGVSTVVGIFSFLPSTPGALLALDPPVLLSAGDGIQLHQVDGTASTGGANWTLSLQFAERP